MTKNLKNTFTNDEIGEIVQKLGNEFVIINNPSYIFSEFEICPLAAKIYNNRQMIAGIVQDMDGTTTTTENLCLYSLETMVRQFTGLLSKDEWNGLDRERDYPHIIGNSTTKHVEYLIRTYRSHKNLENFSKSYIVAALLTLRIGKDANRRREVLANLTYFKCVGLLKEEETVKWLQVKSDDLDTSIPPDMKKLIDNYATQVRTDSFSDQVRAAIDIYYQKYHEILAKIEAQKFEDLKKLVPGKNKRMIEPMPGVGVFLAAAKGWLGKDLELFYDELREHLLSKSDLNLAESDFVEHKKYLKELGQYFERHPIKIAIVTSSIAYEAKIVLNEVFRVLKEQMSEWQIDDFKKQLLLEKFNAPENVFDAIVTASDSSEIRLKPHRDLYSLALHELGIAKEEFDCVIGFEDSESGVIAIRAAGIGLCVAVPFADTEGHDLSYASHMLKGGLPEALLIHHLFLSNKVLIPH